MDTAPIRVAPPRSPAVVRAAMVLGVLAYAACLHMAHVLYLNPAWEYLGFAYQAPTFLNYLASFALISGPAALLPMEFHRPSSVFVILIGMIVYVPTVIVTMGLGDGMFLTYGTPLLSLALAYSFACLSSRIEIRQSKRPTSLPGTTFTYLLVGAWIATSLLIFFQYRDQMQIVGFGEVYEQRSIGLARSAFWAYLQTYYLNVISPALLAIGLLDARRRLLGCLGAAGFVIMYMVAAQKMALIYPIAMIGFYFALTTPTRIFRSTLFLALTLSLGTCIAVLFYVETGASSWFAALLVHRTIAIPGLSLSQYVNVFDQVGWTFWSHVRGISLFVAPPHMLLSNPLWPGLGYLVGEAVYGDPAHNLNANLFASDGYAAAGPAGMLVIGAVLAAWLFVLDRVTAGWDRKFVLLVLLPVVVSLTNGPLFTVLLSFGGLFWTVIFWLCKPARNNGVRKA